MDYVSRRAGILENPGLRTAKLPDGYSPDGSGAFASIFTIPSKGESCLRWRMHPGRYRSLKLI